MRLFEFGIKFDSIPIYLNVPVFCSVIHAFDLWQVYVLCMYAALYQVINRFFASVDYTFLFFMFNSISV